ncbi:probable serine/threonine-protein kinase nek3 isoform X2 [Rhagoletis pomonella]|uniref:probable serine/threonine-protein kinase nek3 isoform X2 n=1 Tax=Rhagoletis pomonella TaxID=28610 RepID=UPI0017874C6E|nr:probable serine/threonine-protein kinase nek3 isoform X2 [Rhagoletis pomonella]
METACIQDTERQLELEDSVIAWQDKYDRLYESHKRVQKVNQSLEDKLLKLVDRNTGERAQLTSDVATLSVRLAQANFNIAKLQREIERYKSDINLAIQLLQCKPDSFMSQKVSSLPIDIQSKVSAYMRLETNSHSDSEGSTSGVGTATTASYKVLPASDSPPPTACPFPPTAMVYSMRGLDAKRNSTDSNMNLSNNNNNIDNGNNENNNIKEPLLNNNITATNNNACESSNTELNTDVIANGNNNTNTTTNSSPLSNGDSNDPDMISPIIMAKFLEDELKASEVKHCDTCQCSKQDLTVLADVSRSYTVSTQTPYQLPLSGGGGNLSEPLTQLCLRCHSNLNSPSRTNSPYLMKLVKSSDSVISETKSSVSDLNDMDKLFTPAKKDDLMVNPILGHHRLCDRTAGSGALQHQNSIAAAKLSTTLLYPTTHLGTYGTEKYLLETNSPATGVTQMKTSYQRRFLEGGGTALELLNGVVSTVGSNAMQNVAKKPEEQSTPKSIGNDELDDEAKPLLSGCSQSNLLDYERLKSSAGIELAESAMEQQIKSPASVCGGNDAKQSLMKSAITGSVNSLWSRTSSCEGAKMFETFNRNLIKTIKAENPKNRGPRLCAMRIQQNGQSNILLDNIESMEAVTPVIYKRRERLLDEELDDTKDIITSNATSVQVSIERASEINQDVIVVIAEGATGEEEKLVDTMSIQTEVSERNTNSQSQLNENAQECALTVKEVGDAVTDRLCGGGVEIENAAADNVNGATAALINLLEAPTAQRDSTNAVASLDGVNVRAVEKEFDKRSLSNQKSTLSQPTSALDVALTQAAAATAATTTTGSNNMRLDAQRCAQAQKPKHAGAYYSLQNESSSRNSHNSKSCTQSSSVSDAIDFQESIILRRQQLNRVAEWVQSNTQQLEQQQQQQQQQRVQQQQTPSSANNCDSSGGTDRQSSFSTLDQLDSVSMEKLSMDSGYKTTPQPHTNGYHQTLDDANKSTEDSLSPKTDTNSSLNNNNNCKNSSHFNHYPTSSYNQAAPAQTYTANTYYRRTTRSGLPVPYSSPDPNQSSAAEAFLNNYNNINNNNSACSTTPMLPEQPTCDILNYKYYPSDTDKTRAISAELHTTTQHVDIAQMEYNVKQFLLKQNEWSMRAGATRGGRSGMHTSVSNLSSANSQVTLSSQRTQATAKTLRHLKLFSGVRVGPGVGARVQPASVKDAAAMTGTATTNSRNERELKAKLTSSCGDGVTAALGLSAMPQRTETNL